MPAMSDAFAPGTSIEGVQFHPLTTAAAPLVYRLTFDHLEAVVKNFDPDRHVAIAAVRRGEGLPVPVGLAFGIHRPDAPTAHLKSVVVVPDERERGVGTALLRRWQRAAAERGAEAARARLTEDARASAAVEPLLARCGWDTPERTHVLYKVAGEDFVRIGNEAEWLHASWLRPSFELFPWAELTADERERIQREFESHPAYDEALVPLPRANRTLDAKTSVGLRRDGDVIGWMVNTHVGGTVVFDHLYVPPGHRRMARGVALLGRSILLVHEHRETAYWMTDPDRTAMMRFNERRLGPYVTETFDVFEARRSLRSQS